MFLLFYISLLFTIAFSKAHFESDFNEWHHRNYRDHKLEASIPEVHQLDNGSLPLEKRTELWNQLAQFYHDPQRENSLRAVAEKQKGVYLKPTLKHSPTIQQNIHNFVIVTYMTLPVDGSYHNWLCYMELHDYKAIVVYDTRADDTGLDLLVNSTRNYASRIVLVPYPRSLFWTEVARKSNPMLESFRRKQRPYLSYLPIHKMFGSITKLVPILDFLQLGYNVINMDFDIAFIRDFIPYIFDVQSPADLIFSAERRDCEDRGASKAQGLRTEPNGGFLVWHSTNKTVELARKAIAHMVNTQWFSCQGGLLSAVDSDGFLSTTCRVAAEQRPAAPSEGDINRASVCFLPEDVFQNGLLTFTCSRWPTDSIDTLLKAKNLSDLTLEPTSGLEYIHRLNMYADVLTNVTDRNGVIYDGRLVPFFIHANFNYNIKSIVFEDYGSYLVNQTANGVVCKDINFKKLAQRLSNGYSWEALYSAAKLHDDYLQLLATQGH